MSVIKAFFGLGKLPKVVKYFEFQSFDDVNKMGGAIRAIREEARTSGAQLTKSQQKYLDDQQRQVEMVFEQLQQPTTQTGIRGTQSAKILDMQGKEIPKESKIMGGKASETEAEIKTRMEKENKQAVGNIRKKNLRDDISKLENKRAARALQLEQRGVEDFETDNLYNKINEQINDLELKLDFEDMIDPEDFAQGGRAGYRFGLGPLFNFLNKKSPAKAYTDYLKSVKDRMKAGKEAEVAGEVVPIAATGALLTNQLKKKLKAMNEEEKKRIEKEAMEELKKDMEKRAQGGRAGFNNGGAPSIKYDFDREKSGPMGPKFETNDPKEAAREILRRLIQIEGAQIPISEKGQLGVAIPKLDTIGAGGLINLLGGELEFGGMKDFGTGDKKLGVKFRKKFDKGGMSRRKFMQIMGGLAALPIVGKFFKGAKPAAKIAEVATKTPVVKPPEYFFDLAAKIKILGKESSTARRERMVEVNYKNYTLEEDLVTGDMTIIKRKGDPDFAYEEEVMVLRKGQADETTKGKTPPDEYEELTVRPDGEGKMKDVEDGIEPEGIKEILDEVGQGGGNLDQRTLEEIARGKLASGGVAMMLGE